MSIIKCVKYGFGAGIGWILAKTLVVGLTRLAEGGDYEVSVERTDADECCETTDEKKEDN